ncbi:MAG: DUF2807 domain-containing protein [Chitinophagales bacterium]
MKKILLLGNLLFLFLAFENTAHSQQVTTGKTSSQTRSLSNFNFVNLKMSGIIYLKQADQFSVMIEAPVEIIDKITTEVSENTLVIENKNKYTIGYMPAVKIYVTLPKPNGLEVNGSGDIIAQTDITSNFLSVNVAGSGRIKLMGISASKINIQLLGSGQISHGEVITESALIEIRGSGDYEGAKLTSRLISASMDGSGSIKLSTIAAGKLWMQNRGSGSIRQLSGMATVVLFENNGSGDISAGELNGGTISVSNAGSGNIDVGICETLNAELSGSGDVRYHGTPKTMRKNVSGSGDVSQH